MTSPKIPTSSPPSRRRRNICIAITAVLLALALIILVLAFTVFRPKQAVTTVTSVKLAGVKVGFDPSNLGVDLNVTVLLGFSVTNPNRVGCRYGDGTAEVYYKGALVGEAAIPPGEIGAKETIATEVRLTIFADRFAGVDGLYSDVMSGTLMMTTYTRIPGRVNILGIKRHMTMYSTCEVAINTMSRSVSNSSCKSRTKL